MWCRRYYHLFYYQFSFGFRQTYVAETLAEKFEVAFAKLRRDASSQGVADTHGATDAAENTIVASAKVPVSLCRMGEERPSFTHFESVIRMACRVASLLGLRIWDDVNNFDY